MLRHFLTFCASKSRESKRLDPRQTRGTYEVLEQRTLLTASGFLTDFELTQSSETTQIVGRLFHDADGDGLQSSDELALSGWRVFVDDNRNGIYESDEISVTTGFDGGYQLSNISAGLHVISVDLADGWESSGEMPALWPNAASRSDTGTNLLQDAPQQATDNIVQALQRDHYAEQLVVQISDRILSDENALETIREKQALLGHSIIEQSQFGLELWDVGPSLHDAYSLWSSDPGIEYIGPNYEITDAQAQPNDELFDVMWGLDNTGQSGGSPDADIDAPEAWAMNTSIAEVVVGVIDSGIDYTHPDLAANIWTNPGEIPGNGIDDDGNGFIDDIHGWDFVDGDGDPMDGDGHGTHVAGTIAAQSNNAIGVAGVATNAKLMALRFLDDSGNGSIYNALLSLQYATMMGADITNNSWVGDSYFPGMQFAINQAAEAGSLYVVCAGNGRNNNDTSPTYPAGYLGDNVISVASTTDKDVLSSFSNYGATSVHVAAPGSNILSTKMGGGYTTKSGTSMAAPHVAGVASLLLSKRPDLTPAEVRAAILQGSDQVTALNGKTISNGRLNAANALMQVAPTNGMFVNVTQSTLTIDPIGVVSTSSQSSTYTQIIDDGDTGFFQSGFNAQRNSSVASAFDSDNHIIRGGEGSANWTFTNLVDGTYQVAATWAHKYDNKYNVTDAPFSVLDGNGQLLAANQIDQSVAPAEFSADGANWNVLATVDVSGGQLTVRLEPGSNANRYTVADAIRVERVVSTSAESAMVDDFFCCYGEHQN
ncbi:MAG: hypothetical protein CMJ74_11075 [Planctomycetaceae bacterium]|nr:hypothetical protein [Planctomycetaceae bacterium]